MQNVLTYASARVVQNVINSAMDQLVNVNNVIDLNEVLFSVWSPRIRLEM